MLSERGHLILAKIERELPSRKSAQTFAEKLEFLDQLKRASDSYERRLVLEATRREKL